jgi:hypothetical protein
MVISFDASAASVAVRGLRDEKAKGVRSPQSSLEVFDES